MSATLHLSADDVRKVRAARGLAPDEQRAIAREIDPALVKGADGWTWGRKAFDLILAEQGIDVCPPEVAIVFSLEVSEYMAAKGPGAHGARHLVTKSSPEPAIYRHDHDRKPYAAVTTTSEAAPAYVRRRAVKSAPLTPPRLTGPGLVVLGQLVAFEGTTDAGTFERWNAPCAGFLLCGDRRSNDLHVIRTGAARKEAPIWIMRNGSPYRITDRGIEW